MNKIFIFCLLAFIVAIAATNNQVDEIVDPDQHTCIHDQISQEFEPELSTEFYHGSYQRLNRRRARPIRIHIDYSNLHNDGVDRRHVNHIKKVLSAAKKFLQERLSVNRIRGRLRFNSHRDSCHKAQIPHQLKSRGVNADLVILATAKHEPHKGYAAWATACILDRRSGRPTWGQTNFNIQHIKHGHDKFNRQVSVAIHEITHILGFSGNLYKRFIDRYGQRRQNVVQSGYFRGLHGAIITTPKVRQVARRYYRCGRMRGVELENDGGSGSKGAHWEKVTLHNELMTAQDELNGSFSVFTMALLEDSGWYKVDFRKAAPIYWGKGKGCRFVEQGCNAHPQFEEFCPRPSRRNICLLDGNHYGFCSGNQFSRSDRCYFRKQYSNGNCRDPNKNNESRGIRQAVQIRGFKAGYNSKCVKSSIIQDGYRAGQFTGCFKSKCRGTRTIIFDIGHMSLVCRRQGQRVRARNHSGYHGSIVCPNPRKYCRDDYPLCPRHCSGNGYCQKGRCLCNPGFSGRDCSRTGRGQNSYGRRQNSNGRRNRYRRRRNNYGRRRNRQGRRRIRIRYTNSWRCRSCRYWYRRSWIRRCRNSCRIRYV